jgi:hypothetical protein
MAYKKEDDEYCCPLKGRDQQDLMDTANWMGRGTDAIAQRRVATQKIINPDED